MQWIETELKNFLGIQNKTTPNKNSAQLLVGLDPRVKEGELHLQPNIADLFASNPFPTLEFEDGVNSSILGFATIFMPDLLQTDPREVTLVIKKSRINAVTGSGASIAYKDVVSVCARPSFGNGSWSDSWSWLNQIYISKVSNLSGSDSIQITNLGFVPYFGATIYNVTKSKFATIVDIAPLTYWYKLDTPSIFEAGDTVILMKNYSPLANLEANYAATSLNFDYVRVINDLVLSFGGYVNRLALNFGYRKKYFHITGVESQGGSYTNLSLLQGIDNMFITPFNAKADTGTYDVTIADSAHIDKNSVAFSLNYKSAWVIATIVLDDIHEIIVFNGVKGVALTTVTQDVSIDIKIRFATMNKRITKVKIYLAGGNSEGVISQTEDLYQTGINPQTFYKLVREIEVSGSSLKSIWTLKNSGYLELNSAIPVVNYDTFTGFIYNLTEELGYTPTKDYVDSFDQAIITQGRLFVLNPYIDKRYSNKLFYSHISGAGAYMYDAITAENYSDLDNKDGNDVVGLEILPNMDFAVFRQSSIQRLDPNTGSVVETVLGIGAVSKRSIVNFKDKIIFASQNGIFQYNGVSVQDISFGTILNMASGYGYNSITDKSTIIAVRDPLGNCYRFTYSGSALVEYLYMEGFGWFGFTSLLGNGLQYANSQNGEVKILIPTTGIKKTTQIRKANSTFNVLFHTQLFDIATMGEELKATNLFLLRSVWFKFYSAKGTPADPEDGEFKILLVDELGATIGEVFILDADITKGYIHKNLPIVKPIRAFKAILSYPAKSGDYVAEYEGLQVKAIGFTWKPINVGKWSR